MNLQDYFTSAGSLSASELAARIGVKSVAQIRQWQHGYANRLPSPENCLAIELATDGKVTRQELRPNDFWKIWPDLAHLAPTPESSTINLDATDQERRDHERREADQTQAIPPESERRHIAVTPVVIIPDRRGHTPRPKQVNPRAAKRRGK